MLLANLKLGYELLDNDPIEKGIHYGESVLSVISSKMQSVAESVADAVYQPSRSVAPSLPARDFSYRTRTINRSTLAPLQPRVVEAVEPVRLPEPEIQKREIQRSTYGFNLKPRPVMSTQRTLIGVI